MKLLTFAILLWLVGCTNNPTVYIPIVQKPPPVICGSEPHAPSITYLQVEPYACPQGESNKVCLTAKHYENLSVNIQAAIAALKAKNALILFYRDCLKRHNEQIEQMEIEVKEPKQKEKVGFLKRIKQIF